MYFDNDEDDNDLGSSLHPWERMLSLCTSHHELGVALDYHVVERSTQERVQPAARSEKSPLAIDPRRVKHLKPEHVKRDLPQDFSIVYQY